MKILDVEVYRDGGTKLIVTDHGNFWIPANRGKILRVLKGELLTSDNEADPSEIIELLDAMCHDSTMLHWIKRHVS